MPKTASAPQASTTSSAATVSLGRCQAAQHVFHQAQVGADDGGALDRELVVRQQVDGLLRHRVVGVGADHDGGQGGRTGGRGGQAGHGAGRTGRHADAGLDAGGGRHLVGVDRAVLIGAVTGVAGLLGLIAVALSVRVSPDLVSGRFAFLAGAACITSAVAGVFIAWMRLVSSDPA